MGYKQKSGETFFLGRELVSEAFDYGVQLYTSAQTSIFYRLLRLLGAKGGCVSRLSTNGLSHSPLKEGGVCHRLDSHVSCASLVPLHYHGVGRV